ncbi:MAG: carbohydrate ABC transporter permease [Defluviitaleaceae bacterium]|nr:carbohydrate ABC transporter permease [Defluviitaleaceae bacterium]MCL2835323.1 carbohydrate ABC transporter permease [Defluviitaleaceae bacterium]
MKPKEISKSISERIFDSFNILFLLILCAVIIFPYIHVLMVSLNDNATSTVTGLMLWPSAFTLVNYQTLFGNDSIMRALFITVSRIVLVLIYQISLNFMAAYALTRKDLPYKKTIVMFFFIPFFISSGLIPRFILYSSLGLLNNFMVYVLPAGFIFYYFILLRTYLGTIPDSLEESARMDGAGEFKIMTRIYLPLCKPMIATLALLITVETWNNWTDNLYFMTHDRLNTISYELYRVLMERARLQALIQEAIRQGQVTLAGMGATTTQGVRNAQIIVVSLPIIMIYPFLQRYFIKGLMIGGVKE